VEGKIAIALNPLPYRSSL